MFPKFLEVNVECHSDTVSLYFDTKNQFQGHIFVRGHYKEPNCHNDYSANAETGGNFDISFAKCGMRRKREVLFFINFSY